MKAAIYKSYGAPEVLTVEDVEKPIIQPEGQEDRVLVKVYSASVNPFDIYHRKGFLPIRPSHGLFAPKDKILGVDVAGTVEAIGMNVTRFKIGDRVFGSCFGSHAEYVRVREKSIAKMPGNLTFHEAAAVPCTALTALQAIKDVAQIQRGQKVLILGASGGIGHFAVQLAKYYGAEVTAVCSASNLAWVKNLGADHMIDYTREDFAKNGKRYDVILDASATRTFASCKGSLTDSGFYMTENPTKPGSQLWQALFSSLMRDKKYKGVGMTATGGENLEFLRILLEAGKIKPNVEKVYSLNQIAAAHRHVENGHTKGKIVVEIINQ